MFREALIEIIRRLDRARERKLVQASTLLGGFAVSVWGKPRATHDIALVVALGAADLKAGYHPGDPDDPLRDVFRAEMPVGEHVVPVQLIVFEPKWADIVFRREDIVSVLN